MHARVLNQSTWGVMKDENNNYDQFSNVILCGYSFKKTASQKRFLKCYLTVHKTFFITSLKKIWQENLQVFKVSSHGYVFALIQYYFTRYRFKTKNTHQQNEFSICRTNKKRLTGGFFLGFQRIKSTRLEETFPDKSVKFIDSIAYIYLTLPWAWWH